MRIDHLSLGILSGVALYALENENPDASRENRGCRQNPKLHRPTLRDHCTNLHDPFFPILI
jgi:hypothetical protein